MRVAAIAGLAATLACAAADHDTASGDSGSTHAAASSDDTRGADSSGSASSADDGSSSSRDPLAADSSSGEASSSSGEAELPPAIGLVQYDADAHFGDDAFNRAALQMWAEAAVEQGARIIVLPEGSTYGYASPSELWCLPGMDEYAGVRVAMCRRWPSRSPMDLRHYSGSHLRSSTT